MVRLVLIQFLLITNFFLISPRINAQVVDWITVTDTISDFTNITKDDNGGYIQSRQAYQRGTVAYINSQGGILWEKSPCSCNESTMLISFKKSEDQIYTLTGNGALYQTDLNGDNSNLILQVYPDSSVFRLYGFLRHASIQNNKIFYHGYISNDSIYSEIEGVIDVQSLNVTNILNASNGTLRARYITNNNLDIRAYDIGDYDRLMIKDSNDSILLDSVYDFGIDGFRARGVTNIDDQNLIIAGADGSYSGSNGVVISMHNNGTINWIRVYEPDQVQKIFLNGVYFSNDLNGILIVGAIGSYEDVGSYLMLIDSNGNEIWNHRQDIGNGYQQTFGNKINKSDNGESVYAISGTTGLTDHSGPQRSVLYEIDIDEVSSVDSYLNNKLELQLYPNPTDEFIHIESLKSISKVEVYNNQMNLLYNLKDVNLKSISLNMVNYDSGVYFIATYIDSEIIFRRIIKK